MKPRRLDFVDALRGFAALYVLVYHFSLITSPHAIAPGWLAPFTGLGGMGVTLFFVVSAFTLCLSMHDRSQDERRPVLNYFIRRFFRIAPLFYVWIVLYVIRDRIVFDVNHSVMEVGRSAFFVLNFFPGQAQGFVWASWTLGVEMLFYVLFPLFFYYVDTVGKAGSAFLCALVVQSLWRNIVPMIVTDPIVAQSFHQISLLHHLPTFLLGIFVYHLYCLLNIKAANRYGIGYLLLTFFCTSLLGLCYGLFSIGSFEGLNVQAVLFGCFLLGLSITAPKIFVNRLTCFYGKISYSVYLSHATILYFMSSVFSWVYAQMPIVTLSYFSSLALGLGVITLLSYLTYKYIETIGNQMGRALIRLLQQGNLKKGDAPLIVEN